MSSIWHFALAVPDLEQAMEEVGNAFQVTWRPIHRAEAVLKDEHGVDHPVECVFTFSEGGPPAIEMWQSVPGTPLAPPGDTWIHHIGYWVNDLPAEVDRLEGHGWPCFMNAHSVAVHRGPGGLMLEPCDINRDRPFLRDLFPPGAALHGPPRQQRPEAVPDRRRLPPAGPVVAGGHRGLPPRREASPVGRRGGGHPWSIAPYDDHGISPAGIAREGGSA